jgi:hypothetical protein
MRTLLTTAIVLGSIFALSPTADARKAKPSVQPPYYYRAPPPYYSRERLVCEERARAEDPSGRYAGFPCWAREAFGRGSGGRR